MWETGHSHGIQEAGGTLHSYRIPENHAGLRGSDPVVASEQAAGHLARVHTWMDAAVPPSVSFCPWLAGCLLPRRLSQLVGCSCIAWLTSPHQSTPQSTLFWSQGQLLQVDTLPAFLEWSVHVPRHGLDQCWQLEPIHRCPMGCGEVT